MSNKLGGGYRSQSYLGTRADSPPNMVVEDRAPTIYDINFELGDLWEHKYVAGGLPSQDVYMLVNLEGTSTSKGELATWALLGSGAGDLTHLTGDDGVIVRPLGGNINVVGDNINLFTRSTVANELEVYYVGDPGEIFQTNAGAATPAPATGILNIYGGTNMATRATGAPPSDTVLIDMTPNIELIGWVYSHDILYSDLGAHIYAGGITVDAGGINATGPIVLPSLVGPGFLHANAGGTITVSTGAGGAGGWLPVSNAAGAIVWGQLQAGSANITITNAGNVITIDSTAGGFGGLIADDTNTAAPDGANKVIVAGGTLIATTSTVLNTLTVSLVAAGAAASPRVIYAPAAGGAGAWGRIDTAGGATIAEAGGVITITAGAGGTGFGGLIDDAAATALPDGAQKVTIAGGTLIETEANPANTITVSIPDAPAVATPQLIYAPAAGGAGAWGRFAAAGGATVTEAGGVITITAGAGGAGGAVILHTDGADASIDVGDSSFDIVGGNLIETDGATDTVTVSLTQGTSGYVPIGKTGLDPVWGQILGGTDITVNTAVAGQLTINSTLVGGLITLTGDAASVATQDVARNINLLGTANQIVSTGAVSTVTLSISPTLVIPGTLTIAALNHVGMMMTDAAGLVSSLAPGIDGSIPISNGAGVVAWGAIQQGPGSVTVTNAGGVITIGGGGGVSSGARYFDANVGFAEAATVIHPAPSIYILGGTNMNTAGGTDTVVVNLNKAIVLPMTTTTGLGELNQGIIAIGTNTTPSLPTDRFIHSYGTRNTFIGHTVANFTLTVADAVNNVAVGNNSLDALTSGKYNAICGSSAAGALTSGSYNSVLGASAMISATSSDYSVAVGYGALHDLSTGQFSTAIGYNALANITSSYGNLAIGYNAGINLGIGAVPEYNVLIANDGVAGDAHTIRIGQTGGAAFEQNKTYIAGVRGTVGSGTHWLVYTDVNEKLCSQSGPTITGNITVTGTLKGADIQGTNIASSSLQASIISSDTTGVLTKVTATDGCMIPTSWKTTLPTVMGVRWKKLIAGSGITIGEDMATPGITINATTGYVALAARLNGVLSNVTGDDTKVYLGAVGGVLMPSYVNLGGGAYVSGGAGVAAQYTVPVTGTYLLAFNICLNGIRAPVPPPPPPAPAGVDPITIETTTDKWCFFPTLTWNGWQSNSSNSYNVIASLTAGDWVKWYIQLDYRPGPDFTVNGRMKCIGVDGVIAGLTFTHVSVTLLAR